MAFRRLRAPAAALVAFMAGVLLLGASAPARAQVAGDLTLQSDYRLRGHSLSGGDPVAILNLSYDHPTGVYANGSTIGVFREGGMELLGLTGNIGYARRVTPDLSLDAGLMRSEYREVYGLEEEVGYNEYYVGLYTHGVSTHLYYSPDYYYRGVETLYGELEGAREVAANVRLSAHVGLLNYIGMPAGPRNQYDWRIAASRQFGSLDLRAALSGGGPGSVEYGPDSQTALVASASWMF